MGHSGFVKPNTIHYELIFIQPLHPPIYPPSRLENGPKSYVLETTDVVAVDVISDLVFMPKRDT